MQLISSILRVYKDVLTCGSFMLEYMKRQMLKEALEQLPERPYQEEACHALKEMLV
ncbi:hypothetical protein CLAVI_000319 [Candidatus Clavichlamydia salmonicola]|nr:hypothetical protein [Candidatus Clavichlamydia salmonicola]